MRSKFNVILTQRCRTNLGSILVSHERLDGKKSTKLLNRILHGGLVGRGNALGGNLKGFRETRTEQKRDTLRVWQYALINLENIVRNVGCGRHRKSRVVLALCLEE